MAAGRPNPGQRKGGGRRRSGGPKGGAPKPPPAGTEVRRIAIEAVRRIDEESAYANLLLPQLLGAGDLDDRDRNLVTEIVYGATRMRRALDWLADRHLVSPPPPALRASLRVGAYQLAFLRTPAHAAVSATVEASAKRNRPPVNAILRKIAREVDGAAVDGVVPRDFWPDDGTRLSYPDWLVRRLRDDLGDAAASGMLETMNLAPTVSERDDGYVQDEASQWVAAAVDAQPGLLVLDTCAAPGGKATALAATGATVIAADGRHGRARLVAANATRLGADTVSVVTADATAPPFAAASFDRVLVDAPCSGLGVLRRRADARWRITPADIDTLAALQAAMLDAAVPLVRPGGVLVYSVCTVTTAETLAVAEAFAERHPRLVAMPMDDDRWTVLGSGGRLLPQDHDTDGMCLFRWRVPT